MDNFLSILYRGMGCRMCIVFSLLLCLHESGYTQVNDSTIADSLTGIPVVSDTFSFQRIQTATTGKKFKIAGIVRDRETGEPVPFATVFFPRTPIGTPSDENGKFLLEFEKYLNDTFRVQALGYDDYYYIVDKSKDSLYLIVELNTSARQLSEVVVRPYEDPIVALMKRVLARKSSNNPEKFENYSYEAYNKVEVDVLNLTREEFMKLPFPYLKKFSFIYDNVDSSEGVPFLPFYLTETISDLYYQQKPKRTKEFIKASKLEGIDNEVFSRTMTKYLGNMFLTVNPYDNYVQLFDKKYVSPISNSALAFYKYTIIDTQRVYGYDVITLHFMPQRIGENCFEGLIGIVDSVFALQYISAKVPNEANLNWIKNAEFYRTYEPLGDSVWFCIKENTTAELQALTDLPFLPALRVSRTNSYREVEVNKDSITDVLNNPEYKLDVIVTDSANKHNEEYWEQARHEELNKNEKAIYETFDSIQRSPVYKKFKNLVRFVATGVIPFGPIEIGPYWNLYSFNNIEGNRIQLSLGTTTKFSKSLYLNGYLAYGTRDKRYKYRAEALWLLRNEFPRSYLFASYTHDIDRTVNYYDHVNFNNLVAIRKSNIPLKFMFTDNARVEYMKEYYSGFRHMLTVLHKEYHPYAPLPDVNVFNDVHGNVVNTLKQTEVNVLFRYAYKERFITGNFYRVSLGSKFPIVELRYGVGLKGVLNGAYDYHRINFNVSDDIKIPPFGSLYMNLFCGKYWGVLPYPLLQVHPGNESYIYNKYAFSMMNQYEFLSDQYAGIMLEHSLGGGIFNYIPLIKKLKLRQFWTAKGVIGSLNDANRNLNFNKGFTFRTLENSPYIELGTGIENILRLFRVDFVWRVVSQKLPNEPYDKYFGIFGSLKVTF